LKTDENLMAHIYSGSRLCPGLRLSRSDYCFRALILRPTRHFKRDLYYTQYNIL